MYISTNAHLNVNSTEFVAWRLEGETPTNTFKVRDDGQEITFFADFQTLRNMKDAIEQYLDEHKDTEEQEIVDAEIEMRSPASTEEIDF